MARLEALADCCPALLQPLLSRLTSLTISPRQAGAVCSALPSRTHLVRLTVSDLGGGPGLDTVCPRLLGRAAGLVRELTLCPGAGPPQLAAVLGAGGRLARLDLTGSDLSTLPAPALSPAAKLTSLSLANTKLKAEQV